MVKQNKLSPSLKLEILKRIIDDQPVSPMIDDLKPDEILGVYRFVLEKALEFGKALQGPKFSQKDISRQLDPIDLERINTTGRTLDNQNLINALQKTKKQIDILAAAARKFATSH